MIDHLQHRLAHLEKDHAELDKRIDGMESTGVFEDATMEVLKKQRLHLKDEIVKIQHKITHELGTQEKN
jgi:uncharacterized protein YdcH (DUF465 family)